jgi:NADH:ubiquinone oxidoreductase subunit 3 (subunit A)
MTPFTLAIAAIAALAIVLVAVGLALSNRGGVTTERLERYAAGKKEEGKQGKPGEGGFAV